MPSFARELGQRALAEHPAGRKRKHEPTLVAEVPCRVEDGNRGPGQRHPVLELRFHARRGHGPGGCGLVDLVPPRAANLAGLAGGQHEELERQRSRPVGARRAHPFKRIRDFGVRKRPLVRPPHAVLRQRRGVRVARRVVLAVALRDGPLHDAADALADAPGGFLEPRELSANAQLLHPLDLSPAPFLAGFVEEPEKRGLEVIKSLEVDALLEPD